MRAISLPVQNHAGRLAFFNGVQPHRARDYRPLKQITTLTSLYFPNSSCLPNFGGLNVVV